MPPNKKSRTSCRTFLSCPRLDGVRFAHTSQKVGLTQSPTRLRRDGLFTCLLRQVNLPRIQLKKPSTLRVGGFVPKTGFEPAQPFGHYHLKVARLPISPPGPQPKIRSAEGKYSNYFLSEMVKVVPFPSSDCLTNREPR